MNRSWRLAALALAASLLSASPVLAAPGKSGAKKAAAPKCPVCKESLAVKKDTSHPIAVKVQGKTYYACPRGASALKKSQAVPKAACPADKGPACENCPAHAKKAK